MTDKRCPRCGISIEESAQRCECGFDFTACTLTKDEMEQVAKKNSGSVLWDIIWFFIAVIGIPLLKGFIESLNLAVLIGLYGAAFAVWLIVRTVKSKQKK